MTTLMTREQLHRQIEDLPDDLVEQISNFVQFIMNKRVASPGHADWGDALWQEFVLEQFFSEEDKVHYTLHDAKEIYIP